MSFFAGEINYWCEWPSNGKFIPSRVVAEKWPYLLYGFLQPKLTFVDADQTQGLSSIWRKMLTRSQHASMQANQFNQTPSIIIAQRPEFDKVLLMQPSVSVSRRRTVMANNNQRPPANRRRRVTFADPIQTTMQDVNSSPPAAAAAHQGTKPVTTYYCVLFTF